MVEYQGRIVHEAPFWPDDTKTPDCKVCGDVGLVRETIDEERLDVMLPCWACKKGKAK